MLHSSNAHASIWTGSLCGRRPLGDGEGCPLQEGTDKGISRRLDCEYKLKSKAPETEFKFGSRLQKKRFTLKRLYNIRSPNQKRTLQITPLVFYWLSSTSSLNTSEPSSSVSSECLQSTRFSRYSSSFNKRCFSQKSVEKSPSVVVLRQERDGPYEYREQDQIVPCPTMDPDRYLDSASPERSFDDFLNYYVASPRNDSYSWPQFEEGRTWSGAFQPSTSSSASYAAQHRSTPGCISDSQQPLQSASFSSYGSGSLVSEALVANLPELNDLLDGGETVEVTQPASAGNWVQPSQSASNVSPQQDLIDLDSVLTESSFDLAELDQYLYANDNLGESSQSESAFGLIIREEENQYESLVSVQLDHTYGTATSSQTDSVELDESILNEFLTPLNPQPSQMGRYEAELAVSPSYTETFTNLEPYLGNDSTLISPPQNQWTYISPSPREEPSQTPDSVCSDTNVSTTSSAAQGTSEYRMKRDKNNIASQKSRLKRQNKFKELKEEEVELKRRHTELLATVSDLERQVKDFKEIMMKAITA